MIYRSYELFVVKLNEISIKGQSVMESMFLAIVNMIRHGRWRAVDHLTHPWVILTMRRYDDPLFA